MKELLITLITLAGLFIGVYYHDSLVGGGQEDPAAEDGNFRLWAIITGNHDPGSPESLFFRYSLRHGAAGPASAGSVR